jgi:hypothetical protein
MQSAQGRRGFLRVVTAATASVLAVPATPGRPADQQSAFHRPCSRIKSSPGSTASLRQDPGIYDLRQFTPTL